MQDSNILKEISARLKTSSAVVPALLAALIMLPIAAAGLAFGPIQYGWLFSTMILASSLVLLGQIIFFTFVDRDRLHNEEHIERRMQIDKGQSIIGSNLDQKQITVDGGRLTGNSNEEPNNA